MNGLGFFAQTIYPIQCCSICDDLLNLISYVLFMRLYGFQALKLIQDPKFFLRSIGPKQRHDSMNAVIPAFVD